MPRETTSAVKVGLTVVAGLVVLGAAVLMVGDQNFLFTATHRYSVHFLSVGGLAEDSPVQLNGVNVGKVDQIVLSEQIDTQSLEVWLKIERRYAPRIREDSVARIKTLGLLGDKYVSVTSGSPGVPEIANGGEIQADEPTNVDALIESGEDVIDNIVTTARSLSVILGRMERGEGLLGELVAQRDEGDSLTDSVTTTLGSVERLAGRLEAGDGVLGRLLTDQKLADQLSSSVGRLDGILGQFEHGEGLLPALLNDPASKESFDGLTAQAEETLRGLGGVVEDLRSGAGLLPRLLHDEELSRQLTDELEQLLQRLNSLTEKVTEGDGTAAQLINDPSIYQALNDIVVGINESKLLRWLIRNRQKKGIKKRYREAQEEPAIVEPPSANPGPDP